MNLIEDGAELRKIMAWAVRRRFLLRSPEITGEFCSGAKVCPAGAAAIQAMTRTVTGSSDVSDEMKAVTNPGRSVAAGGGAPVRGNWLSACFKRRTLGVSPE